jgi:hypothetical protein
VLVATKLYEPLWQAKHQQHKSWDDLFAEMADLWLQTQGKCPIPTGNPPR